MCELSKSVHRNQRAMGVASAKMGDCPGEVDHRMEDGR